MVTRNDSNTVAVTRARTANIVLSTRKYIKVNAFKEKGKWKEEGTYITYENSYERWKKVRSSTR